MRFSRAEDTQNLLDLIMAIPGGVITMSMDIEGMVEKSTNLNVAATIRHDDECTGDGDATKFRSPSGKAATSLC